MNAKATHARPLDIVHDFLGSKILDQIDFKHAGLRNLKVQLAKLNVVSVHDYLQMIGRKDPVDLKWPANTRKASAKLAQHVTKTLETMSGLPGFGRAAGALSLVDAIIVLANQYSSEYARIVGSQAFENGKATGLVEGERQGYAQGRDDGENVGRASRKYDFLINDGKQWTAVSAGMEILRLFAEGAEYFTFSVGIQDNFFPGATFFGSLKVSVPLADMADLVTRNHRMPVKTTIDTKKMGEPFLIAGNKVEGSITFDFESNRGSFDILLVQE